MKYEFTPIIDHEANEQFEANLNNFMVINILATRYLEL